MALGPLTKGECTKTLSKTKKVKLAQKFSYMFHLLPFQVQT
jgi:hypothetical protein